MTGWRPHSIVRNTMSWRRIFGFVLETINDLTLRFPCLFLYSQISTWLAAVVKMFF